MPKTPPAAIAPKECVVCSSPIPKTRTYCDRCRRLVKNHHAEYLKKRLALQKAWSTAQQAFLCHFSHLPLEEIDRDSPFAPFSALASELNFEFPSAPILHSSPV